jgi:hypothetical protein
MLGSLSGLQPPQGSLCTTCCDIPHAYFNLDTRGLNAPSYYLDLGPACDVTARAGCPLCRLVSHVLNFSHRPTKADEPPALNSLENIVTLSTSSCCFEVSDKGGRKGRICRLSSSPFEYTPDQESFFIRAWHRYGRPPPGNPDPVYPVIDSEDYYSGEYHRSINPSQLDFDQIGAWLVACETGHERCHLASLSRTNQPINITFIDVIERRMVVATSAERYVALSYVWGKSKKYKAKMDTIDQLRVSGFLSKDNEDIPFVLRDAMDIVQAIGQRYLWIDSICIVQDDPINQEQVYNMDRIYAGALFTLIALSAAHADSGLAGVRLGTRRFSSLVEKIHDQDLTAAFPEVGDVFESSVYATRGWTFQEHILSTRRLYITEHQAYWECAQEGWAEDTVGRSSFNSKLDPIKDLLDRGQADLTKWFGFYEFLVQNYTRRMLSCPGDILTAFIGIASRLEIWCDERIAAGIPLGPLFRALFFVPCAATSTTAPQRRILLGRNFPSWSWLAWHGSITFAFTQIDKARDIFVVKGLIKNVRLMAVDSDSFFPVVPHDPSGTFHHADGGSCETERWALDNVSRATVPIADEVDDDQDEGSVFTRGEWDTAAYFRLQRPICLSFVAPSVPLEYFTIPSDTFSQGTYDGLTLHLTRVSDPLGTPCGIICSAPGQDVLDEMRRSGQDLRLVAISFGKKTSQIRGLPGTNRQGSILLRDQDTSDGEENWCGCVIDVMLISRDPGTNRAERLAVGKIHSNAWWRAECHLERICLI